jgi:hypothetical protein
MSHNQVFFEPEAITVITTAFEKTLRADRQNRVTIYGPKDDGTFLVEFRTAEWPCAPRNV